MMRHAEQQLVLCSLLFSVKDLMDSARVWVRVRVRVRVCARVCPRAAQPSASAAALAHLLRQRHWRDGHLSADRDGRVRQLERRLARPAGTPRAPGTLPLRGAPG